MGLKGVSGVQQSDSRREFFSTLSVSESYMFGNYIMESVASCVSHTRRQKHFLFNYQIIFHIFHS